MAKDKHIYGEVNSRNGLQTVFREIRKDVEAAKSKPALTELYRRARYLVTLTNSLAWRKKFDGEIGEIRSVAKDEFARTARKINQHAHALGVEDSYDQKWGPGR